MKGLLFVVILLLNSLFSLGQDRVMRLLYDSATQASYIPEYVFTEDIKGVYIPFDQNDGYQINWPAPEIDGRYVLVVTGKQLYLRSGHDNPNPNALYWMVGITPMQYNAIVKKIKQSRKVIAGNGAQKLQYSYQQFIKADGPYPNLQRLIKLFNEGLPAEEKISLISRSIFDKIHVVRIIDMLEE